jgi:hypothetical protein
MASLTGYAQLQARLHALGGTGDASLMRGIGAAVVREEKLLVHRKTGQTGRSIRVASSTPTSVTVEAGYAAPFLEFGTRPHTITPKAARALRWAASSSGRRLTGTPRVGAAVVFATIVHHPGTRPYPFMIPGAKIALSKVGADSIIRVWNGAA